MRNIKFKAYIKNLKWAVPVKIINFGCKTVEVDLSDGNGDYCEYDFDEIELMQYTGLEDKDNIEIYEGDVLKVIDQLGHVTNKFIGLVSFDNGSFTIKDDSWIHYRWMDYVTEVIGNIYENPELLEVEI